MPSDVSVTVAIDGKTVFAHGANGAVDPVGCALTGLQAAMSHFAGLRGGNMTGAIAGFGALKMQAQTQMQDSINTKGPSL